MDYTLSYSSIIYMDINELVENLRVNFRTQIDIYEKKISNLTKVISEVTH